MAVKIKCKGFTLIEVLFAAAVASMLFYVVYATFFSSVKQFSTNQTNLEAVSITQTVLDIIQNSASRQLVSKEVEESFLLPDGKQSTLSLFVSESSEKGVYKGIKHTFSIKPSPDNEYFYLVENGKTHPNLTLAALQFEVLRVESISTTQKLFFLEICVTGATPKKKGSAERKEFTLKGLVALTAQTEFINNQHWNPNPFVYKHF